MEHLGEEFANEQGYTLYSTQVDSNGEHAQAMYMKGDLCLVIDEKGGVLSCVIGLAHCFIPNFSIPNKNFHIFEDQLLRIIKACEEAG